MSKKISLTVRVELLEIVTTFEALNFTIAVCFCKVELELGRSFVGMNIINAGVMVSDIFEV